MVSKFSRYPPVSAFATNSASRLFYHSRGVYAGGFSEAPKNRPFFFLTRARVRTLEHLYFACGSMRAAFQCWAAPSLTIIWTSAVAASEAETLVVMAAS
jgi:hypothetical protein